MTIVLQTLLQKASDARFLREMIGCATERLMVLETDALCASFRASAAPSGSITPADTVTAIGRPGLGLSNAGGPGCGGSYFPSFIKLRWMAEKALMAVIQQAYIQGISTRSDDGPVKALGLGRQRVRAE